MLLYVLARTKLRIVILDIFYCNHSFLYEIGLETVGVLKCAVGQ